jgi:hypothetical protein
MELWDVAPDQKVACIRSLRGEIPIPHYDLGGQAITIAGQDAGDEIAAIADDEVTPAPVG